MNMNVLIHTQMTLVSVVICWGKSTYQQQKWKKYTHTHHKSIQAMKLCLAQEDKQTPSQTTWHNKLIIIKIIHFHINGVKSCFTGAVRCWLPRLICSAVARVARELHHWLFWNQRFNESDCTITETQTDTRHISCVFSYCVLQAVFVKSPTLDDDTGPAHVSG